MLAELSIMISRLGVELLDRKGGIATPLAQLPPEAPGQGLLKESTMINITKVEIIFLNACMISPFMDCFPNRTPVKQGFPHLKVRALTLDIFDKTSFNICNPLPVQSRAATGS